MAADADTQPTRVSRQPESAAAAERRARFKPIVAGEDYLNSLRGHIDLYLFGARVDDPVDHPIIRPSMNALAATYTLALEDPELATALSPYIGKRVNRFVHGAGSPQAQRIQIHRGMNSEAKKRLATDLAGVTASASKKP